MNVIFASGDISTTIYAASTISIVEAPIITMYHHFHKCINREVIINTNDNDDIIHVTSNTDFVSSSFTNNIFS